VSPEIERLAFTAAAVAIVLIPLPLVAFWGWRYGSSSKASPLGFVARLALVSTLASWTWSVAVGHGASFMPLPAVFCAYFDMKYSYVSCFPPAWITPSVTAAAFFTLAVVSERWFRSRRNAL
jgi:hypothetical protein